LPGALQKAAVQNSNLQALATADASIKSSGLSPIGPEFDASKRRLPP
jgi:hypothetical protein